MSDLSKFLHLDGTALLGSINDVLKSVAQAHGLPTTEAELDSSSVGTLAAHIEALKYDGVSVSRDSLLTLFGGMIDAAPDLSDKKKEDFKALLRDLITGGVPAS